MIFDRQARLALVVATLTLLVSGIGFRYAVRAANAYLQKEPVPLRAPLTSISMRLGAWIATGPDAQLTAELEEQLGTEHYLSRTYERREGDPVRLDVHITYYTGLIDTVPHIPDRCLVAGGWVQDSLPQNLSLSVDRQAWRRDPRRTNLRWEEPYWIHTYRHPVTGKPVTVRMPFGDLLLRTSTFQIEGRPDIRVHAGYFFIANGEATPWPERVRQFAFDLTTRYAYYCKIQFSMVQAGDVSPERFAAAVSDLLDELLPELMRCLPDWSEVEAGADGRHST